MARTLIEFPGRPHFSTDYTVTISDVNSAKHLGADKIFSIMIESQMRFFTYLGYGQPHDIEGVGYIMGDAELVFKSESKYGDKLQIDVAACHFSDKSFELRYRVINQTRSAVVAYIKAGMVFVDYESGRVQAVPANFRSKFVD